MGVVAGIGAVLFAVLTLVAAYHGDFGIATVFAVIYGLIHSRFF